MTIEEVQKKILDFRDARDWKQFHNPKDLTISMSLEVGELLEHFQWKNKEEMEKHVKTHKKELSEEMADIFYWVLLTSNELDIDLEKAFKEKMEINVKKYPVSKAKGKHTKYTEL